MSFGAILKELWKIDNIIINVKWRLGAVIYYLVLQDISSET